MLPPDSPNVMIYLAVSRGRRRHPMKGSDKWGQGGRGPRIEFLLAGLVVVALLGGYFYYVESSGFSSGEKAGEISVVTTTGLACDSNGLPQAVQRVAQAPAFTNLTAGLCYNFIGESQGVMTFAYYNGTITYPCGDAPMLSPASEIEVNVSASQSVTGVDLLSPESFAGIQSETCVPSIPIAVTSLQDVESTIPAVPQLNLTLSVPEGGRSVSSLEVVLTLDGGSQIFKFGGVAPSSPLNPSSSASSTELILSNLSFRGNEIYPMTISGTFVGGQAFSSQAHVQVAGVP